MKHPEALLQWVTIVIMTGLSKCCTCVRDHPQTVLCNSDWAFLGKVTDTEVQTDAAGNVVGERHTAYVYKVIKGESEKLQDKEKIHVFTPSSDDSCKLNVTKELKAVFTGMLNSEMDLTMNKCNWYVDYTEVPRCQRRYMFRKMYLQNCDCRIKACSGEDCTKKEPRQECMWDTSQANTDSKDCYKDFGYCYFHKGCGLCSWKRCRNYYDCQDGIPVQ